MTDRTEATFRFEFRVGETMATAAERVYREAKAESADEIERLRELLDRSQARAEGLANMLNDSEARRFEANNA